METVPVHKCIPFKWQISGKVNPRDLADSASSGSDMRVTIIVICVGAFFGILAVALTTRYARAELNRIIEEREAAEAEETESKATADAQPANPAVTAVNDNSECMDA